MTDEIEQAAFEQTALDYLNLGLSLLDAAGIEWRAAPVIGEGVNSVGIVIEGVTIENNTLTVVVDDGSSEVHGLA